LIRIVERDVRSLCSCRSRCINGRQRQREKIHLFGREELNKVGNYVGGRARAWAGGYCYPLGGGIEERSGCYRSALSSTRRLEKKKREGVPRSFLAKQHTSHGDKKKTRARGENGKGYIINMLTRLL